MPGNRRCPASWCDTVIVGAGAAGLYCAYLLGEAKVPCLVLERGNIPGRKLAASGGGHANFSNANMAASFFEGAGAKEFCQRALKAHTPEKLLNRISRFGLHYIQKDKGKYFLLEPARKLVECLLNGIKGNISLNTAAHGITPCGNKFEIHTKRGTLRCRRLILAPGSPARPKLAQCPDCWQLPRDLDLPVLPPRPALTPLLYTDDSCAKFAELSGNSIHVHATLLPRLDSRPEISGSLMFAHFGLSGPAILNISLYFQENDVLLLNFLPEENFEQLCDAAGSKTALEILRERMPPRLAKALLPENLAQRKCAELSRKERKVLGKAVNAREFAKLRPGGLARAEICAGGVRLDALDPYTMQTLKYPRLYVLGEAQNVAGPIGGYNLHWAFASATCAAQAVLKDLKAYHAPSCYFKHCAG